MKCFFAPWRYKFIKSEKPDHCVFCHALSENNDKVYHIVKRGTHSFVMLNKFPYTSGHVMIIPNRHTSDLVSLTTEEALEITSFIQEFTKVLKKSFNPEGFNIGMNIGKPGGAGIEDHLHVHIVPRWNGDNNFMPVIGHTRIHPIDLDTVFEIIKENL
ncbi:MAG: HIT domain-containing protein [Caldisericia bacterium]